MTKYFLRFAADIKINESVETDDSSSSEDDEPKIKKKRISKGESKPEKSLKRKYESGDGSDKHSDEESTKRLKPSSKGDHEQGNCNYQGLLSCPVEVKVSKGLTLRCVVNPM